MRPPGRFLATLSLLACFAALAGRRMVAAGETSPKPNIVFVLLDNVGQEWFGCYGSLEGRTPQIDRLAQTGVRFEHCYASPICSVSRVLALTGRYPFRTGWTFHHDAGIYCGGNFDGQRERTFARLLRDAGYATCIAGKWQVSNFNDPGQANCLRGHGFDEELVTPGGKEDSKYWDPLLIRNGVREVRNGAYAPDLFTDFAVDFMRRHREQPFLVYLPLTLVHLPLPPTPLHRDAKAPLQEMFGDALAYADQLVGRIAKALEDLGLRDRTVLVISSDNGSESKFAARTRAGLVQGKIYTFAEVSIDMPLIVNCPKMIAGGRTGALADYSDLLPTFAGLAHAKVPVGLKVDGQSFASWLLGQKSRPPRSWIHTAFEDVRVVRDERFKLYGSGALFDLSADPGETRDLAGSQEEAAVAARARLGEVLKSFPADAPLGFEPQSVTARKYREKHRQPEQTTQSPPTP